MALSFKRQAVLAILYFATQTFLFSQSELLINKEGIPPIEHYPSSKYVGNDQVWDIIQDDRGLIYIATTSSLNEFDGEEWRIIPTQPGQIGISFAKTASGRIYICGYNMLGYLSQDSLGLTSFVSLYEYLEDDIEYGIIGFATAKGHKVLFSGAEYTMIFDEQDNTFQTHNNHALSNINFFIGEEAFFHGTGIGLFQMEKDTISMTPTGEYFKDIVVSAVMNLTDTSVIISSYYQGFYYFDSDTAYQINELSDSFYLTRYPRNMTKLGSDYFGVTFLQGGLLVLNNDFKPILQIDKENGLTSEMYNGYLDKSNNLWLGSNNGLYRIDLASAHSLIDERLGLEGNITDIAVDQSNLYVSGSQGIFWRALEPTERKDGKLVADRSFSKVTGSQLYTDWLMQGKEPMLVKAGGSIGQIKNKKYEIVLAVRSESFAITYLRDSTFAIASGKNGKMLELFQLAGDNWNHIRTIPYDSLPDMVFRFIYDQKSDRIWGNNEQTLFSFKLSENLTEGMEYRQYDGSDGLPATDQIKLNLLGDETVFATMADGLYRYDHVQDTFTKYEQFHDVFDSLGVVTVSKQSDKIYWASVGYYQKGKVTIEQNKATLDYGVANVIPGNNSWIKHQSELGALLAGSTGLFVIPDDRQETKTFDFPPLVRKMVLTANEDTTVYHGRAVKDGIVLEADQNSIRIETAVPYYRHSEFTEYAYKLEPFESNWSEWTSLNQKEYTNLPHGKYTLNIRSKNGFLEVSETGKFEFEIKTPWYFSAMAYMLYVVTFGLVVYLIVYLNSRRLKKVNERLEQIIEERTKEILDQKNVIQKSLEERESLLKEIHHRVKNNLQIIASLLYLQSGKFEDENFKKVLEEGQGRVRSMALIHQKLYENEDLKNIPFGEYLQELIGEIKTSFGAEAQNIKVKIDVDQVNFDVETAIPLGLIINELATNAFKYAFEELNEGNFSISLVRESGDYLLTVSDDGKGLPDEINIKKTKSLGLRLVKMLSVQLEGEYEIRSEKGTVFNLKFVA